MRIHNFEVEERLARFRADLEAAFIAGYEAGSKDTREAIFRAAQAPVMEAENRRQIGQEEGNREPVRRAPKGLAGDVIASILADGGGLTHQEIQERVGQADSRIAVATIHGEMRRGLQAGRYVRRGSRWFLRPVINSGDSGVSPDCHTSGTMRTA